MHTIVDRPFGLPELITTVVDLPVPPSVNRLWRYSQGKGHRTVYLAPEYKAWISEADALAMSRHALRGMQMITGPFEAHVYIEDSARLDLDNALKAILDWAQRRSLIKNDKHAERITIERTQKANAPDGVRLTLREMVA